MKGKQNGIEQQNPHDAQPQPVTQTDHHPAHSIGGREIRDRVHLQLYPYLRIHLRIHVRGCRALGLCR